MAAAENLNLKSKPKPKVVIPLSSSGSGLSYSAPSSPSSRTAKDHKDLVVSEAMAFSLSFSLFQWIFFLNMKGIRWTP